MEIERNTYLQQLILKKDNGMVKVIAGGMSKPWRNEEGFVIMGMRYFLLNPDSLEF